MENESEKKFFRLKHIIPRNLSAASVSASAIQPVNKQTASVNAPEEFVFKMTYGNVAAKIWGPPDGHPVFAIHGWLDNASSFDALIPLLPPNLRIVAVDTAGHGFSDPFPPDIAYNFVDSALAIERLARHFKWEKFSIIGHSLGGAMGMLFAGTFPEKVDKLVCLDVVRVIPTKTETIDLRLRKAVNKLLKLENAILAGPEKPMSYEVAIDKCVTGTFGSLDKKACDILFKRGLRKVAEDGYVFSRDRRLLAAPLSFIAKEHQLFLAHKVTADVLVIKFSEGPYFEAPEDYEEHIEALKTKSKRVQYVQVEGMHHTHLTNPASVAPIISDFFKGL